MPTLRDRFFDWFCGAPRPSRARKLTKEEQDLLRKYNVAPLNTRRRVYHNDRYFLLEGTEVHSFPYPFHQNSLQGLKYLLGVAFQGRPMEAFARLAGGEYWWRRWEWDRATGKYVRRSDSI